MRISDWSSDVCSSDLLAALLAIVGLWMQVFLRHYIAPRLEQQAPAAPAFAAPPSRRAMTATPLKAHEDGHWPAEDRTSAVEGKSVEGRVDLGGRRIIKKKMKEQYK